MSYKRHIINILSTIILGACIFGLAGSPAMSPILMAASQLVAIICVVIWVRTSAIVEAIEGSSNGRPKRVGESDAR